MVTLRSATALNASTTQEKPSLRNRRSSQSSSSSSSGDDLVTYEEETYSKDDSPIKKTNRTTLQKVDRRPESTFYLKKRSEMTLAEKICSLAIVPETLHFTVDQSSDRGKVPVHPAWKENLFIWPRAVLPLLIQYSAQKFFGNTWPVYAAYPFYVFSYMAFALSVMKRLNKYCVHYGVFDEKQIGRDRTPDKSVNHLAFGVTSYMFVRTAMDFYMHYDKDVAPLTDITWTYPLRLMAWQLAFDYFFYCYHRTTHEVDSLWHIHKHHHTTKHPTAILAILAEDKQEFLEIFFIPLLASLLIPMSFSEMWLTLQVTIYVEMLGHSGIRAYWAHPVLNAILRPFDMELAIEDHDLHHRYGKSGRNYGKQSRVWDTIFGTKGERIETYGMNGHAPAPANLIPADE